MKKQRTKPITGQLYRRGKKGIFCLEWIANGKRFKKSMGTADEIKAKALRNKYLNKYGLKDETQFQQEQLNAVKTADASHKQHIEDIRIKLNIIDSWSAFLRSTSRPDSGETTLRQYSFQWGAFVDWVQAQYPETLLLCDITKEMADGYFFKIKNKLSKGTINKHIRLCKLVISTLQEQENIFKNPFDHIKSLKDTQNHRKEIAWDKLSEICNKAEGEIKLLFFIGIYTGLRLGDCCLLTWDEVDLMRGWIITVPNKTARHHDKPLQIPIMLALRNMLEEISKKGRGYVLPDLANKYQKSRDNVTDIVQTLFKSCGVQIHKSGTGEESRGKDGKIKKRAVLQYGFHSLRHTTVTLLQEVGTPQAVIQALVGHRTLAMTNRYTHIGEKALKEAVNSIPLLESQENSGEWKIRQQLKELAGSESIKKIKAAIALLGKTEICW